MNTQHSQDRLHKRIPLHGLPDVSRAARIQMEDVLDQWMIPEITKITAALIASELLTNAYKYAGGYTPLDLFMVNDALVIQVSDSMGSQPPKLIPLTDPLAESGRGLHLVQNLSDKWGWYHLQEWPWKAVWARISVPRREPPQCAV